MDDTLANAAYTMTKFFWDTVLLFCFVLLIMALWAVMKYLFHLIHNLYHRGDPR